MPWRSALAMSDYRRAWLAAAASWPAIGRFISADPSGFSGGDHNLYRYVGNDPLNKVDPTGLAARMLGNSGSNTNIIDEYRYLGSPGHQQYLAEQQAGANSYWDSFAFLGDSFDLIESPVADVPRYSFVDRSNLWSSTASTEPGQLDWASYIQNFSYLPDLYENRYNSFVVSPLQRIIDDQRQAQLQRIQLELVGAHLVGSSGFNPWLDPGVPIDPLPEEITARERGVFRGIGAFVTAKVGAGLSATGYGAVVGVPLLAWSGDQLDTARMELWYGRHSDSCLGSA